MLALKIYFRYGKCRCPFCVAYDISRRQFNSVDEISKHLNNKHSWNGTYQYLVSSIRNRRGNQLVVITGTCACGCGESISYPKNNFTPPHGPPYYLSGHNSRIYDIVPGSFQKGHIPWNEGTKGLTGPNSTSFKKGHVPAQERGGRYTNPDGQNYEWNGEYQPCGARMYRAVSRSIIEKELGRKLTSQEVVIHLDGDAGNDERSNLKLITRAENATRNRWGNYKAPAKPKRVKRIIKVKKLGRPKKIKKPISPKKIKLAKPKVIAKPIKTTFKIVESTKRPASLFCPKCGTLMPPKSPCPRC